MIVDKIDKDSLREYLNDCARHVDFNVDRAFDITLNFMKFHNGMVVPTHSILEMKELEDKWYNSLSKDDPDYSVYSDPYYFCEVWLCWKNYSRRYLKDICKANSLFNKSIVDDMINVNTVVDLGCGFGYTTAGLKEIFTNAIVYGTNIKESNQYKLAEDHGRRYGFSVIENTDNTKADLVFASEYFEHFERPIEHLEYILKTLNPKYMLIANTFNGKAIGHFNKYKHYDNIFDGKKASKEFNNHLRKAGYKKQDTNCWNNRPSYWKKEEIRGLDQFF